MMNPVLKLIDICTKDESFPFNFDGAWNLSYLEILSWSSEYYNINGKNIL